MNVYVPSFVGKGVWVMYKGEIKIIETDDFDVAYPCPWGEAHGEKPMLMIKLVDIDDPVPCHEIKPFKKVSER